jgi:hypothetical protein
LKDELTEAMRRYFEEELDQWDLFKMRSEKYGTVYISFSRSLLHGDESDYTLIGEDKESDDETANAKA